MAAEAYAEVVAAPYEVFVAPPDTAFPKVDAIHSAILSAGWFEFGTQGVNNQTDAGVTINVGSTEAWFTPAGSTLPVKGWRTAETMDVGFVLADVTVEQLAKVLDNATVATVAAASGKAGEKSINLKRGVQIHTYALLVRGLSPYDDGTDTFTCQYEFTRVAQSAAPSIKYVKGTPAEVACTFSILDDVIGEDPAVYRAQTAHPLT